MNKLKQLRETIQLEDGTIKYILIAIIKGMIGGIVFLTSIHLILNLIA